MNSTPTPAERSRQILDAALACFLAKGYAATSIAEIRSRSGASTGSIYHFFAGKPGLAEALLRDATAGWSLASGAASDPNALPEESIKASVSGLVSWGLSSPAQLRFLSEIRHLANGDPDLAGVRSLLLAGEASASNQYARMLALGAVRNLPWPIAHALMLGPAYNYLRLNPTPAASEAGSLAALFAEAAWQAVRA